MAIAYAVAFTAWIALSEFVLSRLVPDRFLRIAIGLLFVAVTALCLHLALRRRTIIRDAELGALERRDLEQAHNALAELEARLRLIVGAAAEAIVTTDDQGLVLTWNREAERVFGYMEEEAIGEDLCKTIVPADDQARCRELLRTPTQRRIDLTGVRRDGTEFPMELSVIPVEWGKRTLHTAFIRDISDRVRAAREAGHVAAIVNASADAIFAATTDGTIVSWNAAAERIFGLHAGVAKGSSIARLFPAGSTSTVQWLLDSVVHAIAIEATPLECVRRETEMFKAFVSVSPMREGGAVSGAAFVVRDASEQLMELDRVKDAEILASLGRLAAATGHQFNNVLMGIQPFVDILKKQELPTNAMRAVEQIGKSVERGRRVTMEIQSFTRASEAPALRSVAVGKWLADLRSDLDLALGTDVELVVEVLDPEITLTADPVKLKPVFLNLAANARDAMPQGGRFTIVVRDSPTPPAHAVDGHTAWVEIVLRDTGDGLDEESQRRIFEPLFAKKRGGSGLELATVQQIVRSHGGSIDVASQKGSGTEFRILLPRAAAAPAEREETRAAPSAIRPRRVLLVEDDTNVALGLSQALGEHGMHVDVVHTGARVLPALRAFTPEVVVLDIRLPDANGFDVYREIAQVRPDLPVIFSTGHADEFDLEAVEPLRLPHVELLRKPYATETLLAVIERVMRSGVR